MRRSSALGVLVASSVALVGAWRLGQGATTSGGTALAAPVGPTATATGAPAPSASAAKKPAARSTSPVSTPQSFTGAAEQTQYGTVQVKAVIKGGKLVDVVPLHLTDQGGRSVSISASAEPTLRQEALAAGSARINAVSGASYTSAGYIQSLQSALDAARAAGA